MKIRSLISAAAAFAVATALSAGGAQAQATCTPTGFFRGSINMTAALINPPGTVSGTVDATGCNVGIYYSGGATAVVDNADVFGSNYFGILVNGDSSAVSVDVTNSHIHDIGETPPNGTQHGVGLYYRACSAAGSATGNIQGNTVERYQKGGIVANCTGTAVQISDNNVIGEGAVDYIAQNGIQVGYGANASVMRNSVSGNSYRGANNASSGGVLIVGGDCYGSGTGLGLTTGTQVVKNALTGNDVGAFISNLSADCVTASSAQTNVKVINNKISYGVVNNTTGGGTNPPLPYQAGISDSGNNDKLINNAISGLGYADDPAGGTYTIDTSYGSTAAKVHANSFNE